MFVRNETQKEFTLTNEQFVKIQKLVYTQTGIVLHDHKKKYGLQSVISTVA